MKKRITILFVLSIIVMDIFSQSVYEDALKIKTYVDSSGLLKDDNASQDDFMPIFKRYNFGSTLQTYNDLIAATAPRGVNENLFIYSLLDITSSSPGGFNTPNALTASLSSVGGLDITNIADGFAKFIVKRTKQELSITFFEKFKNELDSTPDLQTVFPQTYRAMSSIDKDIYMFEAYIQTLRESFEKDLASLPSNLPTIIDNHEPFFNAMPELKAKLLSGFYIAQSIQDKQHPGEIIENYPDEIWESGNSNFQATFKTLKLFSKSFKDSINADDNYWISNSDIKKIFNDDILLKIYLGLLEQQAKTDVINFVDKTGTSISFSQIIHNSFPVYTQYRSFLKSITLKTQLLETKIKGLKKNDNDSLRFENYYGITSGTIDLMKFSLKIQKLPSFPTLKVDFDSITKKYFDIAQTSADIAIDVNRRNYSSAVVNTVHLYCETFKKNNLDSYIRTHPNEMQNYRSVKFDNISKALFKYGSLMAAITQAKSSDDVEAAIEAFVLPSGSARIKRETNFNVALNAYCGLFVGNEYEKISINNSPTINSYGVTAPIGISVSWGAKKFLWMPCKRPGHFSHTLFLSVIDLGAITAFRFANDTTKTLSKIELKDIISPGIFYSIGIPKSPISFNFGYQITPFLREVNTSNNTFKSSYSRFSISLCVDLPMLNFYTKPRD